MIAIGICGASGSGKSTLADKIAEGLSCNSFVLGLDCYYRDNAHIPFEERVHLNYDSPGIFDFDSIVEDIISLKAGEPITKKGYDYTKHLRADSNELIQPPEVLIVEGIHTFYDERLMDLFDLKVFMHVDVDVCILRRLERDVKQRGRTIDGVISQYMATVKPMYERYIKNYITRSDFAVMNGGRNQNSIQAICGFIESRLIPNRSNLL